MITTRPRPALRPIPTHVLKEMIAWWLRWDIEPIGGKRWRKYVEQRSYSLGR